MLTAITFPFVFSYVGQDGSADPQRPLYSCRDGDAGDADDAEQPSG